jgi:hypothetical protein
VTRALIVLGCLLALPATLRAEEAPLVTWKGCSDLACMGQIKMRVRLAAPEDAAGTYNFSFFTNYEVYFEDLSGPRPRKLLHLTQPDSTFLFSDVQSAEEAEAFRTKYQTRVARVMILVLRVVAAGFPEGAGALPTTWDSRSVELDRSRFDVAARRVTHDSFVFRVQDPDHVVEGDWIITKLAPWPDSKSMAGWIASNGVTIPNLTLGELRQLRRR